MKILLALLISLLFSFMANAQVTHYLGTKGEVVDFDTAMIINLPAYRLELASQMAKDSLIDSLQTLYYDQKKQETLLAQQHFQETVEGISEMLAERQEEGREEKPRLKWYRNPILYVGIGLLIGVYLIE